MTHGSSRNSGRAAPRRRRARAAAPPVLDPAKFNPLSPAFFQNPYPWYAALREHAPVIPVGADLWFFLHADCRAILDQTETFLKHPPGPYDLSGSSSPIRRATPGCAS